MKAYEPEEFSGDTRWILNAYPSDEKEWEKFEKSGLQQVPKEGTDGKKFVRFRRSVRKVFPQDDEATYWNPPEITGEVNVTYVDEATKEKVKSYKRSEKRKIETMGEQLPIGNGSEGVINLCIYDSGKGKGHRWESLKVTKLVVYDPDAKKENSDGSKESRAEEKAAGEEAAKKATNSKSEKAKDSKESSIKEDLNDEIPW